MYRPAITLHVGSEPAPPRGPHLRERTDCRDRIRLRRGLVRPVALHAREPQRHAAGVARRALHAVEGDLDLVAGNLGLNHSYTTSAEARFGVYAGDLDGDRRSEIMFTRERDGVEHPFHGLAMLGRVMEPLSIRFLTHESFAELSMREIFGEQRLDDALRYQVDTFASVWLENRGDRGFTARALPMMAQISPVRSLVVHDVDEDGVPDGGGRFGRSSSSSESGVLGTEVGVLCPPGCFGCFSQGAVEPLRSGPGLAGSALAGGLVVSGAHPGP